MNGRRANLQEIQRWMQSVLMHPGGVAEALHSPETRQHLPVELQDLESVVTRSKALSSEQRLEIYVDAYYERLLECLREEFPATCHLLGAELFNALAFGYLQQSPSRSYTLAALGAGFPQFLEDTRLHASSAPESAPRSWPEFVIELARYERLARDVFDGPGSERLPKLPAAELNRSASNVRGETRLVCCPSLKLARYDHPVHVYWMDVKHEREPHVCAQSPTCLAIHRRDYGIETHQISPLELEVLTRLQQGAPLAGALEGAASSFYDEFALREASLAQSFQEWALRGYFVSVQRPE